MAGSRAVSIRHALVSVARRLKHLPGGGGSVLSARGRTNGSRSRRILHTRVLRSDIDKSGIGDWEFRRGRGGNGLHVVCIGERGRVRLGAIEHIRLGRARLVAGGG
jgi:hypothetical protein